MKYLAVMHELYECDNNTPSDKIWADVRKLTRKTHSDHALGRWQVLAEIRYEEIK